MQRILAGHAIVLLVSALVGVAAMGGWLGFSSCGGHVWQAYFGYAILVLAALAVLLSSGSFLKRAGLATLVMATFLVARAVGFAAYIDASSPDEYLRQLGSTFTLGLC